MTKILDISKFNHSNDFYGKRTFLLAVKSFELQAIRKRYLASRERNKNQQVGSVERREAAIGGLVKITVENGKITDEQIIAELKEPRGLIYRNGTLALSSENEVYVFDREIRVIKDPWFSYIHTLDISPNGENILIASSSHSFAI